MFFLLQCILCLDIPPDDGLLLQTYSTDYIGRQNVFFSFGSAGQTLEELGLNQTQIKENRYNAIRLPVPFWLQFIQGNYHVYPLRQLIFNYSFISFSPIVLKAPPIEIFTVKPVHMYVKNNQKSQNLTINEVITTSRQIFIPQPHIIQIRPGAIALYTFYICPLERGIFSDILFFRTNFGVIPYTVSYSSYSRDDSYSLSVLNHQFTSNEVNISIKLPSDFPENNISILYDTSLFESTKTFVSGRRYAFLGSSGLTISSYLTFINILTPESNRTYPLTILVSPKPLQPYYPIIIVPTVTAKGESTEGEIKIVNPTNLTFEILSVSLESGAPSNVKAEKTASQIICEKKTHTVIGRVIVTGDKEGEISTTVKVEFVQYASGSNTRYEIQIPVKATVVYGSLIPSDKEMYMLPNTTGKFTIINNFKVPVVIFTARPDTTSFSVSPFESFLLMPGEESPKFDVIFEFKSADTPCETVITIDTNVTSLKIPVYGSTGRITIYDSDSDSTIGRALLKRDLGKRYIDSVQNFTFYVNNPNPVQFEIYRIKGSSGIDLQCEDSYVVEPFSALPINIMVSFNRNEEVKRNDQINFYGAGKSLMILFIWTPVNGSLFVSTDLPHDICYGRKYSANFSLYSTFPSALKIDNVLSADGKSKFRLKENILNLKPEQSVFGGKMSIRLTQDFIETTKYLKLLNNEKNWRKIFNSWSDTSFYISVDLLFQVMPLYYIKASYVFQMFFEKFGDINLNIGKVLIGSYRNTSLAIPNDFDVPVHYEIQDNEQMRFEDTEFVLQRGSIAIVNFLFFGKFLGHSYSVVPVLTNVTPPFFVNVSANIVDVKMRVDSKQIIFNITSITNFRQKKNLTIFNKGETDILLDDFVIIPRNKNKDEQVPLKLTGSCGHFLAANSSCELLITASSWLLKNSSYDMTVQSLKTRKIIRLEIIVSQSVENKLFFFNTIGRNALLGAAVLFPLMIIFHSFAKSSVNKRNIKQRIEELPSEIERLSTVTSAKCSVSTQFANPNEATGGAWIQVHREKEINVSKELLDALRSSLKAIEGSAS